MRDFATGILRLGTFHCGMYTFNKSHPDNFLDRLSEAIRYVSPTCTDCLFARSTPDVVIVVALAVVSKGTNVISGGSVVVVVTVGIVPFDISPV